jgi:DNA gyrase/topoisomerase IV subunit B
LRRWPSASTSRHGGLTAAAPPRLCHDPAATTTATATATRQRFRRPLALHRRRLFSGQRASPILRRSQAFLNAGLNITLIDWRGSAEAAEAGAAEGGGPRVQTCCHQGGLAEYVGMICQDKTPLFTDVKDEPTLVAKRELKGVAIDVAMRWSSDQYTDNLVSFANGVHTPNGGTHVDGFKAAITRVLNAEARRASWSKEADLACRAAP